MSNNQDPAYRRPKRMPSDTKRFLITLPQSELDAIQTLLGYYTEVFGLKLTVSGVIRAALRDLKERLDRDFVKALVDSPKESMDEFEGLKAQEKRRAMEANFISRRG